MRRDRKWEEYNKSIETKKVYVATKFSAGCQHKEEIVATKMLLSLEGRNSIAIRYLLSRQEIKELYRKNTVTDKFMFQHNEEKKGKISIATESSSVATLITATWKSL